MSSRESDAPRTSEPDEWIPLLDEYTLPPSNPDPFRATRLKLYALVLCLNLSSQILVPTQTKIFEEIYCLQWYQSHGSELALPNGDIPERLCKIAPIQKQVSSLQGWLEFYEAAPCLLMAIPFGILADMIGRKKVFFLNVTVIALRQGWIAFIMACSDKIDLRAIWLEALLNFLSGGDIVAEVLFVCVLTDICVREELATVFFRFGALGQLSQILGPLVAAWLMRFNPWWAISIGLGLLALVVMITASIPETLSSDHASDQRLEDESSNPLQHGGESVTRRILDAFKELRIVWTDRRLVLLILIYPCRMMANALGALIQRYVSLRYHWTLANATLLYSLQAVATGFVLLAILPVLMKLLQNQFHLSAIQQNVVMSRAAIVVIVTAYVLEGAAPRIPLLIIGLCIGTLGVGLPATLRALTSAMVEQKDNGRVFSVMALSETLSNMIAFPTTAALFNAGIEKGGGLWLGLPFFITAAAMALALVALCSLNFERKHGS